MPPALLFVCSTCWIVVGLPVSVMLIASTYALRIGSDDACHAGFRLILISLPGTYEVIWYGPSAIMCCADAALPGRYFSLSIGAGDHESIVIAPARYAAGSVRWTVSCSPLAVTPEIWWVFMYLLIAAR